MTEHLKLNWDYKNTLTTHGCFSLTLKTKGQTMLSKKAAVQLHIIN